MKILVVDDGPRIFLERNILLGIKERAERT
jgi:hypothetical protein